MRTLTLGTRGSALALWQARTVAGLLEASGARVELAIIRTEGDRLQQRPLTETGTKRLFVKEIEDALMRGDVDLAVHSAKDMPAVLPDGLDIAAVLPREDPRDALVLGESVKVVDLAAAVAHLGETPVVGTSSVRRVAQLSGLLPQATFAPIRGNVDTRLRKLDAGEFHAIVLAAAGMRRLGFAARISAAIPVEVCVPAPGQGIVAVEIRSDDDETRRALAPISDHPAAVSLIAERTVVEALGGGCQLPLGAIALHASGGLQLYGVVASPDGRQVIRREATGPASDAAALGRQLADALAEGGARAILNDARKA
ncbi:MAG: hydroxymethylbilane synthase [Acidobacteria bacterium RIFCSPLOWO2_02_FULL_67_36]|nr:MAG: hydroxymethylbilane synthase [Acidobacteria bacterium RIFCSPLOWO2_02_FULL_67_36]OFW19095.1 MAG: hydroxymethylbilane synthase [Acidobacteria bacterium RIFCSPLOWO2_12_FULL_66_21]